MSKFKFSVGPWNVHAGADSYGPETRKEIDLETKFAKFAEIYLKIKEAEQVFLVPLFQVLYMLFYLLMS